MSRHMIDFVDRMRLFADVVTVAKNRTNTRAQSNDSKHTKLLTEQLNLPADYKRLFIVKYLFVSIWSMQHKFSGVGAFVYVCVYVRLYMFLCRYGIYEQ